MLHDAVFVGIGIVVGTFMPAVGRKIKAFFVKEAPVVKADVTKKL
jgi:hypothetical protein